MDLIDSTGEQMTHAGNSTGLSCPEPWELVEICIHLGIFLGFLSLHLTHDVAAKSAAVTNYLLSTCANTMLDACYCVISENLNNMEPLMRIQALVFADSGNSVKNVLESYSFSVRMIPTYIK